jgi:hypothetical protein
MLWAALPCYKLMNEWVDSNFQGHPMLVGFFIQYQFKNPLTPQDLSTITIKVDMIKTRFKGVQTA